MEPFNVYPLLNITPVQAQGSYLWDASGTQYLDLYGGHAVISIGHTHPHYTQTLTEQLNRIGFYSNSVQNPLQVQLAEKLGQLSGYPDYQLFLCNSGAEANENALKVASFASGKDKIIYFSKAFHGRTSGAVAITDNPKIIAPVNQSNKYIKLPFNDIEALENEFQSRTDIAAVIVEGIQGVAGVNIPTPSFLQAIEQLCKTNGAFFIADEIQSGYGRSGTFFAHQQAQVTPSIITVAKGMGNGFPVAGVLIAPYIAPQYGMLGTTFGGNYLACAASLAVLEVMEQENLIENSKNLGDFLYESLQKLPHISQIRYQGLMMGIELEVPCEPIRKQLLTDYQILTGNASCPNTLRILPALNVPKEALERFIQAFTNILHNL